MNEVDCILNPNDIFETTQDKGESKKKNKDRESLTKY